MSRLDDVDWRLDLCGQVEPGTAAAFGRLAADPRVTYHGMLPLKDLAARMAVAEVFVFPTLADDSARVVWEALAAGCYVVTTANAGSIVAGRRARAADCPRQPARPLPTPCAMPRASGPEPPASARAMPLWCAAAIARRITGRACSICMSACCAGRMRPRHGSGHGGLWGAGGSPLQDRERWHTARHGTGPGDRNPWRGGGRDMTPDGAGGIGRAGAASRGSPSGLRHADGSGSGKGLALAAFITPTLIWMEFSVVGRVFVPELILIGLLPFLLMTRGRLLADPLPRTFLMLAALWLASQVLTDLIRETDFRDYSRGQAKIVFTAANFCALYLLLYGSRRRLVLFALGLAVGGYLSFRLNPSIFTEAHPWKFGVGPTAALLAALIPLWPPIRRVPFLPALPLLAVSAYSMTVGFRSMAGIALLASLYVLAQQIAGRQRRMRWSSPLGRTLLFVAAVTALTPRCWRCTNRRRREGIWANMRDGPTSGRIRAPSVSCWADDRRSIPPPGR